MFLFTYLPLFHYVYLVIVVVRIKSIRILNNTRKKKRSIYRLPTNAQIEIENEKKKYISFAV